MITRYLKSLIKSLTMQTDGSSQKKMSIFKSGCELLQQVPLQNCGGEFEKTLNQEITPSK